MTSAADISGDAESVLGGFPPDELEEGIANLTRATKYLANWDRAVNPTAFGILSGTGANAMTIAKINAAKGAVGNALTNWLQDVDKIFAGNTNNSYYQTAQEAYSAAYNAVAFDAGTLGQPELSDALEDIAEIPGKLAGGIGNTLSDIVLSFLKGFWPVIVVAAVIVLGYVFRKTLFKTR